MSEVWIFLANPASNGGLAWASLAISVIGFGVAIRQLQKVRRSSEAARLAVEATSRRLRDRAAITEVSTALAQIDGLRVQQQRDDLDGMATSTNLLCDRLAGIQAFDIVSPEVSARLAGLAATLRLASVMLVTSRSGGMAQKQKRQIGIAVGHVSDHLQNLLTRQRYRPEIEVDGHE